MKLEAMNTAVLNGILKNKYNISVSDPKPDKKEHLFQVTRLFRSSALHNKCFEVRCGYIECKERWEVRLLPFAEKTWDDPELRCILERVEANLKKKNIKLHDAVAKHSRAKEAHVYQEMMSSANEVIEWYVFVIKSIADAIGSL